MKKDKDAKAAIAAADGQAPEAPTKRTRTLTPIEAAVAEWKRAQKRADHLRLRAEKAKAESDGLSEESGAAADEAATAWAKVEAARAGK